MIHINDLVKIYRITNAGFLAKPTFLDTGFVRFFRGQALMQLEEDAGKEAKDDSDLELDPAETTRWGFRNKNLGIYNGKTS